MRGGEDIGGAARNWVRSSIVKRGLPSVPIYEL